MRPNTPELLTNGARVPGSLCLRQGRRLSRPVKCGSDRFVAHARESQPGQMAIPAYI